MSIIKTLIFENEFNAENLFNIKSLAKEIGERMNYKELESIDIDQEGNVIFCWEESLIDDESRQDFIRNEYFTQFRNEAKMFYPEWF